MSGRTATNGAYAWSDPNSYVRSYAVNGLNQYSATSVGGTPQAYSYDPNGNLTSDGIRAYVYDVENRLVSASGGATAALVYDPLGRLFQTSGGSAVLTQFLYDGDELVSEFNLAGTVLRRYVHGPASDDPMVWYEGPSDWDRRSLITNHQGSIVGAVSTAGVAVPVNTYDPWGIPGANNNGRFGYTGQAWIPELGLWYYKARFYSPTLGRFLQVDPIGYKDQMNLYGYVGNDPVNNVDPSGQARVCAKTTDTNVPSCVGVDGNGDGSSKDNDMTRGQMQSFRNAYGGFIANHPNADLSRQGAQILGQSHDSTMLRVATQFVGAILPGVWKNTVVSINNDMGKAGDTQYVWQRGGVPGGLYYTQVNMGWKEQRNNPSELARTLFHEVGHHKDKFGMVTANNPLHQRLDAAARRATMNNGLGGMGCSAIGGYFGHFPDYPGC